MTRWKKAPRSTPSSMTSAMRLSSRLKSSWKPAEHPRLDDGVRGSALQSATAFAPSATARPPLPSSPPTSRSSRWIDGVGLGALGPALGEPLVDPRRERRQVCGQQPLRVDDQAQVRGVGDRLHPDHEVVLGLEYAEDPRPGRALDDLGLRAPAEVVDGVVGLPEVDVERRRECRPPESGALRKRLPAGRVPVALVEYDDRLGRSQRRRRRAPALGWRSSGPRTSLRRCRARRVRRRARRDASARHVGWHVGVVSVFCDAAWCRRLRRGEFDRAGEFAGSALRPARPDRAERVRLRRRHVGERQRAGRAHGLAAASTRTFCR